MKLISLTIVRDDAWVLGASLRAALEWVDSAVVLCHACTDRSEEIADGLRVETGRVHVLRQPRQEWDEMDDRQRTLDYARWLEATHVAIVDADEVLTANLRPLIRGLLEGMPAGHVLDLPMIPLWRSPLMRRVDPCVWTEAVVTAAVSLVDGMAWRTGPEGYQHHARPPVGTTGRWRPTVAGGVMHLQWVDWPRVVAKHALYRARDWRRWPGRESAERIRWRYSLALREDGLRTEPVPAGWWGPELEYVQPTGPGWILEAARREAVALSEVDAAALGVWPLIEEASRG